MIYFDNAATTQHKPPQVAQAVANAIGSFGGVGRGVHEASLDAGMTVFKCRTQIASLFNCEDPSQVAFCQNVTMALNIVIDGLLAEGDHAVTTAASHNSVLRPLYRKVDEEGVELSILPVAQDGSIDYDAFGALFKDNTKLACVTHASNLTGDVYDIARMAKIAHEHNALIIIDAAQTAGVVPIDMGADNLDIVCFTGHKSLYGPQGTGGLCVRGGIDIPWFVVGGSGTHSYDRTHPDWMPERLEAGTINAHGIAGLSAGISYIEDKGVDAIGACVSGLAQRFEAGVRAIPGVTILGGGSSLGRGGIVTLNVGDFDSATVADALSQGYDVCTRAGAHCAPLMHEALGTDKQGAVRFSFSSLNTEDEVDQVIAALTEIAADLQSEG